MIKTPLKTILLFCYMLSLLLASCSDSAAPIYQGSDIKVLKSSFADDLEQEFKRHNYRLDDLNLGIPPLILHTMPKDLSDIKSSSRKKKIFFKSILPMILLANNEVRREREQILALQKTVNSGKILDNNQQQKLAKLAERYKINSANLTSEQAFQELLLRADVIPAELALAQAANESAWGTSRFSQLANNLFGEWTFKPGAGLVPEDRPDGETYEVRRFENVYESIRSYLRNLNTHFAYNELRQLRFEARKSGQSPDGLKLAEGLFRYSIRGDDYVKDVQSLIRTNRLERFAAASLRVSG